MRLLIVSHTPHYLRDGQIVGWGATTREIGHLANLFDSVVHIAPMHDEPAPASAMACESGRVRLRAVPPAGGPRLRDKLGIPMRYPGYARAILQECRQADVIHVRCPANISLLALVLLAFARKPALRWAKYAGDWNRGSGEPISYRFQRWWLDRGLHRGLVTVNGTHPGQAPHIHSFLNPCLTETELAEGASAARGKELRQPVRLIFVGQLEASKGTGVCLEILADLRKAGIEAQLDLIGEGDEDGRFQRQARELGVSARANFHGGLPRPALEPFYERAHFILLPSESEGWPKVLSEAMACGAVPIATATGSVAEFLENFSTGAAIKSRDPKLFSGVIQAYLKDLACWSQHSRNAVQAAQRFSYDNYMNAVRGLLSLPRPEKTTIYAR
ncbi:MAG TPA: glycosyltransferase [Verrucomicrobiae bacterium]|jgi:glycosyltransferase involved in cell wall biosynthesis